MAFTTSISNDSKSNMSALLLFCRRPDTDGRFFHLREKFAFDTAVLRADDAKLVVEIRASSVPAPLASFAFIHINHKISGTALSAEFEPPLNGTSMEYFFAIWVTIHRMSAYAFFISTISSSSSSSRKTLGFMET